MLWVGTGGASLVDCPPASIYPDLHFWAKHCLVSPLELDEGHPLTLDSSSLPVLCALLRCTWDSVQSSRHGVQSHSPDVCGVGEVAGHWLRSRGNLSSALGHQWASRSLPGPDQGGILNLTLESSMNFCGCIRVRAGVGILVGMLRADKCSDRS